MSFVLRISRQARLDLVALHDWIGAASDRQTADNYLRRLDDQMASLRNFPRRGTPRATVKAGLRTVTFERRVLIAYHVGVSVVEILRVVDARRDWTGLLGD